MALDRDAKEWLIGHFKDGVRFEAPMAAHTSFRVGGPAEALAAPDNFKQVQVLMAWMHEKAIPYRIIGGGTNLLVKDQGIRGIVMTLTRCRHPIRQTVLQQDRVIVSATAGARLQTVCRFAVRNGLAGLNFALGIPGTVGGAVIMNAGTRRGAVGEVLVSVDVLTASGAVETIESDRLDFDYRHLSWDKAGFSERPVILGGCFCLHRGDPEALDAEATQILIERKAREPRRYPSAGCFFKNPASGPPAGNLIDRAGLKGIRIGDAEISNKHGNYIINRGKATADQILSLMRRIQETVHDMFNILLEPEVEIVGD